MSRSIATLTVLVLLFPGGGDAEEPPALDPFGPRPAVREDALPGCLAQSDGAVFPGYVHLTRDARLKVFDPEVKRQREIPLRVVERIDCAVLREWMEREWRFKENASNEKVYTGRVYPAREYVHTLTLVNGQKITGSLSAVVYVHEEGARRPRKFILHKRDKGPVGTELKSLLYVRSVRLGDDALAEGQRRAEERKSKDRRGTEDEKAPPGGRPRE